MTYTGLSRRMAGQRHVQAQDPLNAICLVTPRAKSPDHLWVEIEKRIDNASQPKTDRYTYLSFGAVGGMVIAASLFATAQFSAPVSDRVLQAQLTHDGQRFHLTATSKNQRTMVALTTNAPSTPPEKSLEVWFVPQDGSPPGSLGLASNTGALSAHPIPETDWANGVLAVSLENRGGSRSGAPEGPIVATAPLELFF